MLLRPRRSLEKARRTLEDELELQKAALNGQVRRAALAALRILSFRHWIARYPVEAALLAVTGAAMITEAAERRRPGRARQLDGSGRL
ncbi:MAG: hypothetical protein NDJ89_11780 [Oligoflexia bacterium]|nr:hypothetical protein [Oligoflexia bacterium]